MGNLSDVTKKSVLKAIKPLILLLVTLLLILLALNAISNVMHQMLFAGVMLTSLNLILISVMVIFMLMIALKANHAIHNLVQMNKKMALLIELSNKFQSCSNSQKVAHTMAECLEKIFCHSSGVIYLLHPDYNYLEGVASWGGIEAYEKKLSPKQCLLNGYSISEEKIIGKNKIIRICHSLVVDDELLGFIQMEDRRSKKRIIELKKIFITAIATSAVLALANIKIRESLQSKSTHDPLTGLYNRNYLDEYLSSQLNLAMRQNKNIAVIMLDIDHFKEFNDDYGHDIGDLVLMAVGALLQEETRVSDVICRYGGEEFIWILYDCTLPMAQHRAEELRAKISKLSKHYKNKDYRPITISLGISSYPENGTNAEDLITAADTALYRAKRTGRNKVVSYSEADP